MDATLEGSKREGRGKNEAQPPARRRAGFLPSSTARRKEGKAPEGVALAVDPKALLRILHSDSGANTLINLSWTAARRA